MSVRDAGRAGGSVPVVGVIYAVIGLLLFVAGGVLFISPFAAAGYGLWIFVWGLAFLVGAFGRLLEARA